MYFGGGRNARFCCILRHRWKILKKHWAITIQLHVAKTFKNIVYIFQKNQDSFVVAVALEMQTLLLPRWNASFPVKFILSYITDIKLWELYDQIEDMKRMKPFVFDIKQFPISQCVWLSIQMILQWIKWSRNQIENLIIHSFYNPFKKFFLKVF